jgi:5-enolpyruvylshikimate-3-phosphate synthase
MPKRLKFRETYPVAAYFLTAGLLTQNSDITIKNVGFNPTRTGFIDVYKSRGAKIEIFNEEWQVMKRLPT